MYYFCDLCTKLSQYSIHDVRNTFVTPHRNTKKCVNCGSKQVSGQKHDINIKRYFMNYIKPKQKSNNLTVLSKKNLMSDRQVIKHNCERRNIYAKKSDSIQGNVSDITLKEFPLKKLLLTSIKSEQHNKPGYKESDSLHGMQKGWLCFKKEG